MDKAAFFGGRLRELREAAGLTQQGLADKSGLKIGGIRDLEQGRVRPTWETVLAIGEALGVSCEDFTQPPQTQDRPGRGRPAKVKGEAKEEERKKPRGRPAREKGEVKEEEPKKPRGRPRKGNVGREVENAGKNRA